MTDRKDQQGQWIEECPASEPYFEVLGWTGEFMAPVSIPVLPIVAGLKAFGNFREDLELSIPMEANREGVQYVSQAQRERFFFTTLHREALEDTSTYSLEASYDATYPNQSTLVYPDCLLEADPGSCFINTANCQYWEPPDPPNCTTGGNFIGCECSENAECQGQGDCCDGFCSTDECDTPPPPGGGWGGSPPGNPSEPPPGGGGGGGGGGGAGGCNCDNDFEVPGQGTCCECNYTDRTKCARGTMPGQPGDGQICILEGTCEEKIYGVMCSPSCLCMGGNVDDGHCGNDVWYCDEGEIYVESPPGTGKCCTPAEIYGPLGIEGCQDTGNRNYRQRCDEGQPCAPGLFCCDGVCKDVQQGELCCDQYNPYFQWFNDANPDPNINDCSAQYPGYFPCCAASPEMCCPYPQ